MRDVVVETIVLMVNVAMVNACVYQCNYNQTDADYLNF